MNNKANKSPYTNIHIREDTKEKLCAMKHKGQSFDGLFREMIDKLEKNGNVLEVKEEGK